MHTNNQQTKASAEALSILQEQLSTWRQANKSPRPLPEKLWAKAAELARELGVGEVSRALRLQAAALKRRMAAAPVALAPSMGFVELLSPTLGSRIGECAMELESAEGARLRLSLKDIAPLELASLLRGLMRDGL